MPSWRFMQSPNFEILWPLDHVRLVTSASRGTLDPTFQYAGSELFQ